MARPGSQLIHELNEIINLNLERLNDAQIQADQWLNISPNNDFNNSVDLNGETDDKIDENAVFEFKHAAYFTDFDDGYDPNEDPDFEDSEGPEDSEYWKYDILKMISSNKDDIDEEFLHRIDFELDEDAFDDTRVCFKSESENTWSGTWSKSKVSVGPCDHMCCKVWHLEPIHSTGPYEEPDETFLKNHGISSGNGCTDKECKYPNATEILDKASLLAKASIVFNLHTAAKLKSKAKAFKTTV